MRAGVSEKGKIRWVAGWIIAELRLEGITGWMDRWREEHIEQWRK